jgi:hypothetical protein
MMFLAWLAGVLLLLVVVAGVSSLIMRRAEWSSIPFEREPDRHLPTTGFAASQGEQDAE